MKRMRIIYTVIVCLLFAALAYARPQQEEPKSHEKATAPSQQEPEARPEGPERQESAKPEKSDKEAAPDRRAEQQSEKDKAKETSPASKSEREPATSREQNSASAHARPAGKSAHIPDEKFRSSFGREHKFSIGKPTMVNNQPAFQYSGYTFEVIDVWPVEWAYTDDVYVDYIDGDYFLFDLLHPGMRIALFVGM